jgi:hypothetical protein
VQFILNSEKGKETGISPFQYIFGTYDAKHLVFPGVFPTRAESLQYLRRLDEDLESIRNAAKAVQEKVQLGRKREDPLNTYVTGDYILFDEKSTGGVTSKLKPRYSGPYLITSVYKSDITCSHIVTGKQRVVHIDNVKPYFGSKEEAYKAAKVDDDQYEIVSILDYRGDPLKRSSMEFLVRFEDGEELWIPFKKDLESTGQFESYCESLNELEPLLFLEKEWREKQLKYNAAGVCGVNPGLDCYVTLKAWGSEYYSRIGLPTGPIYVVKCKYVKWTTQARKKIDLYCPLFSQQFDWDSTSVRLYGRNLDLTELMVLVDEELCKQYPLILKEA